MDHLQILANLFGFLIFFSFTLIMIETAIKTCW